MAEPFRYGLVLLAAGESRRMGRPKQLLPVGGQPLVRHMAETVLAAPVSPVVVVLGARAAEIEPTLTGLPVHLAINPNWTEGLGSSLSFGIGAALDLDPGLQGVLVVLGDQPGLPAGHLEKLIQLHQQTARGIVASAVEGVPVPPVLFTKEWFPRLRTLAGDTGARALLQEHRTELALVPLAANTDLDTPADYARFTAR